MSVTAKQLSKSGARGKDVDAIVREQLQIIDDKLLHADRSWGRNVVTVELPTSFSIHGLGRQDGQRIIYSSVIRSLANREFDVRIQMDKARTTLYIAWDADLNREEVSAMNKLIRDHRIQAEELAGFRQPPPRVDPIPDKSAGAGTGASVGAGAGATSRRDPGAPEAPSSISEAEKDLLGT